MAETVTLVSLGDSIATGTLTPFSRIHSYVVYLARKFREKGYRPRVYNLAHDGDTTGHLLWKISHSHQFCSVIEQADFITISIGGNDLLKACSIPGFSSINIGAANAGTESFIRNWPCIVDKIKDINPHAKIVVLNIYNPYNHTRYDCKLFELTDEFLTRINNAIAAYADNRYSIADTYSAFKCYEQGKMRQVSCLYPADSVLRNPHPTPAAQRMIADLVFEELGM